MRILKYLITLNANSIELVLSFTCTRKRWIRFTTFFVPSSQGNLVTDRFSCNIQLPLYY